MAFIIKNGEDVAYNVVELVCDTTAEVAQIPTTYAVGSTLFVIENATAYMLNSNKEWKLL